MVHQFLVFQNITHLVDGNSAYSSLQPVRTVFNYGQKLLTDCCNKEMNTNVNITNLTKRTIMPYYNNTKRYVPSVQRTWHVGYISTSRLQMKLCTRHTYRVKFIHWTISDLGTIRECTRNLLSKDCLVTVGSTYSHQSLLSLDRGN